MATTTGRMLLRKPAYVDQVDVLADLDAGLDKIDTEIGIPKVANASPLPVTPFEGMIRYDKNDGYVKAYDAVNLRWERLFPNRQVDVQGAGGAWLVSAAPTFTNLTVGGGTSYEEKILLPGNLVFIKAGFVLGAGGSITGALSYTIPAGFLIDSASNIHSAAASDTIGWGIAELTGGSTRNAIAPRINTLAPDTISFHVASSAVTSSINSTVPFTWATGSRLSFCLLYRSSQVA